MRSAEDWYNILVQCQVRPLVAVPWGQVFYDTVHGDTFSAGDADLRNFLGQVLHESNGLTSLEENLNYQATRLMVVWPSRFPNLAAAQPFAGNPEALANNVYAGRMGNTQPGDGYLFRGRGLVMVTGRTNYKFVGDLLGQDLVDLPGLLTQPHFALEAAIAWWESRIPDACLCDIPRVTRIVNGGQIGLADRINLTNLAGKALA